MVDNGNAFQSASGDALDSTVAAALSFIAKDPLSQPITVQPGVGNYRLPDVYALAANAPNAAQNVAFRKSAHLWLRTPTP